MAQPLHHALQRSSGWLRESGERVREVAEVGVERLTEEVGGPARRKAVVMLAGVLALDSADKGAIGAVAAYLEPGLHIGTTQLGLLVTVSSLVGALATVPVGSLSDRWNRVRLIGVSILFWGLAEAFSALAVSFLMLLLIRLALGAVTATAGPTVASLTGDLFPARDRARMYGFIITGELLGAGFGVLVAGLVAAWVGWRGAFVVLSLPSLGLAWLFLRRLPEPARGGQSRIRVGDERIVPAEEAELHGTGPGRGGAPASRDQSPVLSKVVEAGVEPREEIVLDEDPQGWRLWQAVKYILAVRTNVILIVASSLGYFFLAGLRTFAVIFARGQYHLGQAEATLLVLVVGVGAVAGLVVAGRQTDRLLNRGRVDARLSIGAAGFIVAAAVLLPALTTHALYIAVPCFIVAAFMIAAPNPGMDAARLDVLPSHIWGRGEGVRTLLRNLLEAFAPLIFGVVAGEFGGRHVGFGAAANTLRHSAGSLAETHGLDLAFLVMLAPLAAAGVLLVRARRYYVTDVASAAESERRARRLKPSGP